MPTDVVTPLLRIRQSVVVKLVRPNESPLTRRYRVTVLTSSNNDCEAEEHDKCAEVFYAHFSEKFPLPQATRPSLLHLIAGRSIDKVANRNEFDRKKNRALLL